MASLAIMADGALVNALAFSGTNFIFGQLGDHGKGKMKRHDLAMERFSKGKEEYSRERQQRLDYVNETLRDQRHAKQTFSDLGAAMQEYSKATGQQLSLLRDPPKLADFYNPSRQRKDAEISLVVRGMTVVGLIAYKFFLEVSRDDSQKSKSMARWLSSIAFVSSRSTKAS